MESSSWNWWSHTGNMLMKRPFISETGEAYAHSLLWSPGKESFQSIYYFYSKDGHGMAVCQWHWKCLWTFTLQISQEVELHVGVILFKRWSLQGHLSVMHEKTWLCISIVHISQEGGLQVSMIGLLEKCFWKVHSPQRWSSKSVW